MSVRVCRCTKHTLFEQLGCSVLHVKPFVNCLGKKLIEKKNASGV